MCKQRINIRNSQAWRGQRIGLLGGSFNPPHEGHLRISQVALRMLKLDAIWWLVSPQNPLKNPHDYAPLAQRLRDSQEILKNEPRMLATTIEDDLGTTRSFGTLTALKRCFVHSDFVFLMGRDNAQSFHKWYRWRDIPKLATIGVLARPPAVLQVQNSPLQLDGRLRHIHLSRAQSLPLEAGICVWISQNSLVSKSSSEIRKYK